MSVEYREKAYAKVNFNLVVFPKREDGFHSIQSIFQTINLYDELIVTVDETLPYKKCVIICDSIELPVENTLNLSYNAFCSIAKCEVPGIRVNLIKGIPAGGGLGGGSSDAAALVRVLEKICNLELSGDELDYIATKTGSDVFFFLHCDKKGSGCALVSGRGEVIEKIKPRKDLFLLLIFPKVHSSTKEAYGLIDQMYENLGKANNNIINCPYFGKLEEIYKLNPKQWTFINTFTPVLCSKHAVVNKAVEALKNRGADFTDMSGSGSTVFGVFTSELQAKKEQKFLANSFECKLVTLF